MSSVHSKVLQFLCSMLYPSQDIVDRLLAFFRFLRFFNLFKETLSVAAAAAAAPAAVSTATLSIPHCPPLVVDFVSLLMLLLESFSGLVE